jgi:hypothetical protein
MSDRLVPALTQSQASFLQKLLRGRTDFIKNVGGDGDTRRDSYPHHVFAVSVTVDGGSVGSGSSTCSLTYTVRRRGSTTPLLAGASPQRPRMTNVEYTSPSNNSIGLAFWDNDKTLKLIEALEERPVTEACGSSFSGGGGGGGVGDSVYAEVFTP